MVNILLMVERVVVQEAGRVAMDLCYQQQPEEYAHYPYPDEYLNERNQQYLNDHYGINPGQQQQQMNSMQQQMEGDCEYYFYFKSSIKTLDEIRNKIERSSHFVCLYSFNDIFQ